MPETRNEAAPGGDKAADDRAQRADKDDQDAADQDAVSLEADVGAGADSVNAQLRGFLDDAPISAVIRDSAGRVIHANRRYAEVFALDGFLSGSTTREVMSEPVARVIETGEAVVRTSGQPWQTEVRLLNVDGTPCWYRVDKFPVRGALGQPDAVGSIWTDVTEQKLAEQALVEHHTVAEKTARRLQAALAAITDYAVMIVDADGRIELMNPAGERVWGYRLSEVIGQIGTDFSALVRATEIQGRLQERWDPLTVRIGVSEGEVQYRRKDGSEFVASVVATPIVGPDGRRDGMIGVVRDVTKDKAREAELVTARDAAQQANQAKDELTGRMSHELRTPLNAILGFGQLLERADLSPQPGEWVGHVLTAGRLLLSLVNEVLEFEQVAAGKLQLLLEPVSVSELLDEVLAMIGPLAGAQQVNIINDVPPGTDVAVRADRRRLGQIMTNLLTNAVKYNQPGGQVRLGVGTEGELVRLTVADTGPGIAVDQQAHAAVRRKRLDHRVTRTEPDFDLVCRLAALPVGRSAPGVRRQVARPMGQLVGRHGHAAAVPATGLPEEHLSSATRAPQGIPVLVIGVLADHRW